MLDHSCCTVVDQARLRGVEHHMIKMMCGVRLVDRVLPDIVCDTVGVAVKIKDMLIQSRFRWHGHVIC